MTAPQRLTTAQAKMLEAAKRLRGMDLLDLGAETGLERSAKLRTASSLEALGLGRLVGNMPGEAPTHFDVDPEAVERYLSKLKDWQTRPKSSGKSGRHSEFDTAVILRLDGRELARWRKLAAKKGQAFKAWARDAFLAHEGR